MNKVRKLFTVALSLVGLLATSAEPVGAAGPLPPLYRIYGAVTDTIGRPLEGVKVRDDTRSDLTDAGGSYELDQDGFAPAHLTATRVDLVGRTATVSPELPVDTRRDFVMRYRLSSEFTAPFVSTAVGQATTKLVVTSWAPNPGTPGGPSGTSCVSVNDARTGTDSNATWVAQNGDGSQRWELNLTFAQATAEGVYATTAKAKDCSTGTVLSTDAGAVTNYTIDNRAPAISRISPDDGHNTVYQNQRIQAGLKDEGPSGIALGGVTFDVLDEITGTSQSLAAGYDGAAMVATSTSGLGLTDAHDYRVRVTAVDRAGNRSYLAHENLGADTRAGGFHKTSVTAASAGLAMRTVTCPVSGDLFNRVATCDDVKVDVASATVAVTSSRHSYADGFVVHTASLEAATLRDPVTGQTTNAYASRVATGSEWDNRTVLFRYRTGDRTALPATFTSTPDQQTLGYGTLRVSVPPLWAAAESVELRMQSTSAANTTDGLPAAAICELPLSTSVPCTTDPLWSRWTASLDQGSDAQAIANAHAALGAQIVRVETAPERPLYEAILPPATRSAVAADPSVASLIAGRSQNAEDWYGLTNDVPTQSPELVASSLQWARPTGSVTQRIPLTPTDWAEVAIQRAFDGSALDPPEGELATARVDTFRMRPPAGYTTASGAASLAAGRVRYEAVDGSHWIEARPTGDLGLQFLIHLRDSSAPSSFSLGIELPGGTTVTGAEGGGAVIVREGANDVDPPVAVLSPPEARDALGRTVIVEQSVTESSLEISLGPNQNVSYPVAMSYPDYQPITCTKSTRTGTAFGYLRDYGNCPYGMTFKRAHGYWPEKAHIQGGGYRYLRGSGECSWYPDTMYAFDFQVPCKAHDYCWDMIRVNTPFGYPSVKRDDCDIEFRDAMWEHCDSRRGDFLGHKYDTPFSTECKIDAGAAFAVVKAFGATPQGNPANDAKKPAQWPPTSLLVNGDFTSGFAYWSSWAPSYGVYRDGYRYFTRFSCGGSWGCSVGQARYIDFGDQSTTQGGEVFEVLGEFRCPYGSGYPNCPIRLALLAQRYSDGTWEVIEARSQTVPTGVSQWWLRSMEVTLPQKQYRQLIWRVYNDDPNRVVDVSYGSLKLV